MSVLTKTEIEELKHFLPRGSMAKIAYDTNLSRTYVEQVLKGEAYNAVVLEKAIRIAEAEKLRRDTIATKIKALSN